MGRSLDDVIAALPPHRRKKVEARTKELIAEEMTLRDLRKAVQLTQKTLARRLGVGQDTVSRAEQRADMLLSTLSEHVRAMGGELDIIARFPGRPPVRVNEMGPRVPGGKSTGSRAGRRAGTAA